MNGLDFFSTFPTPVNKNSSSVVEEDDAWGDFVVNSPDLPLGGDSLSITSSKPLDPTNGLEFFADRNEKSSSELTRASSMPSRSDLVKPRGPMPLSVFGVEEEAEGSGATLSSLDFTFKSFSDRGNDNKTSVNNSNAIAGINDLIANLYKQSGNFENKNSKKPDHVNGLSNSHLRENSSNSGITGAHVTGFVMNRPAVWKNVSDSVVSTENLTRIPTSFDLKKVDLDETVVDSKTSGSNLDSNGLSLMLNGQDMRKNLSVSAIRADHLIWNPLSVGTESNLHKNAASSSDGQTNLGSNVLNLGVDQNIRTSGLDPISNRLSSVDQNDNDDEEDGWEFMSAESKSQTAKEILEIEGKNSINVKAQLAVGFENNAHQSGDFNGTSCQDSSLWLSGFDVSRSSPDSNLVSYSNSQSKQNEREKDMNLFPTNGEDSSNSWAFKESFSEPGTVYRDEPWVPNMSPADVETNAADAFQEEQQPEKLKGPLPLSIFGDGELEDSSPAVNGDVSPSPAFSLRSQPKITGRNVSISDLISSLYTHAENNTPVDPSENEDDEFDDDSWEFKGPVQALTDSNIAKGDTATNDDKFKAVFSVNGAEGLNSVPDFGNGEKPMTKAELNNYVVFYTKLKNYLCHIAHDHMENLKKDRGRASDSGEGSEVKIADEEIQDLHNQLVNDIMICGEVSLENLQPKSISINEIIHALQERRLRELDSEYQLSKRLLLAEKDWKLTIELLKHAVMTLNILIFGSLENQSNYFRLWSKVASVCAKELRHGASIWRQASEKNVCNEMLSVSQGREYLLALGEIYRVSRILGASTRLYKPWTLLNPAPNLLTLLNDCTTSWSISGLGEALQHIISNPSKIAEDGYAIALLDSIKRLDGLDSYALYTLVSSQQESMCRISGLVAGVLQDMKMVEWNGAHCFLKLANLWANLISQDPPSPFQVFLNQ